jgi:hypothetical protein
MTITPYHIPRAAVDQLTALELVLPALCNVEYMSCATMLVVDRSTDLPEVPMPPRPASGKHLKSYLRS